ncbi:hypothetical protein M9Y10_038884 [Tritrichomonas musculus]|uniref:Uncharacterized protein n=1 Tax=Tritrichomonas musculus TaxID=1915356 RepID=A0ABR2K9M1_9EUKA
MMWKPKHVPPKGLEPKNMVSETPDLYISLISNPKPKPKIIAEFLDRDLRFQLNHFEDECRSFKFCFHNNDYSRGEVIISIFVDFFKSRLEQFKTYDIDVTFFINTFKEFDTIGIFREIIQLQEPPLFDPSLYFLNILVRCDERFGQFVADYNVLSSIINTLMNFEGNERRVIKNLINLLLAIIPYHRSLDPLYVDFTDNFSGINSKIDDFSLYDDVKQRIVCTLAFYSDPLPDFYPEFLGVVINDMSHTSLKYAFLTCASIMRKSPEFLIILIELDVITKLFEFRRATVKDADTLFPTIDFALAIIETLDALKKTNKHVFKKSYLGESGELNQSTESKESDESDESDESEKESKSESKNENEENEENKDEENFDVSSVIKLSELTFEKVFASLDYGEIRDGLNSSNSQAAIAALHFVTITLPESKKELIISCGHFAQFLDSITISLLAHNEEQILASLTCLQKLVSCDPKMTTQFLNLDFNDTIISLLKSDVNSYIFAIFSFFEELLDNKDAPLRSINNFFMSMMDSGLFEVLNLLVNGKKKKVSKRAREIRTKIDDAANQHD